MSRLLSLCEAAATAGSREGRGWLETRRAIEEALGGTMSGPALAWVYRAWMRQRSEVEI